MSRCCPMWMTALLRRVEHDLTDARYLQGLSHGQDRDPCAEKRGSGCVRGGLSGHYGAFRKRKDHPDEPDRLSGCAYLRKLSAGGAGDHQMLRKGAGGGPEQGDRLRVPVLPSAAQADGAGQCGAAPAVRRREEGGAPGAGPGRAGNSGPCRPAGSPARSAVRRTVPACGHRPRHRGQAPAAAG